MLDYNDLKLHIYTRVMNSGLEYFILSHRYIRELANDSVYLHAGSGSVDHEQISLFMNRFYKTESWFTVDSCGIEKDSYVCKIVKNSAIKNLKFPDISEIEYGILNGELIVNNDLSANNFYIKETTKYLKSINFSKKDAFRQIKYALLLRSYRSWLDEPRDETILNYIHEVYGSSLECKSTASREEKAQIKPVAKHKPSLWETQFLDTIYYNLKYNADFELTKKQKIHLTAIVNKLRKDPISEEKINFITKNCIERNLLL